MSHKYLFNERPRSISPSLAKAIGLDEAIVLQELNHWLEYNKAENKAKEVFRDGRWWSYSSYSAWQKHSFPWWTEHVIKTTFLELEDLGLVLSCSKYNKMPMDRTKWYTIDYVAYDAFLELWESHDCPRRVARRSKSNEAEARVYAEFLHAWEAIKNDLPNVVTTTMDGAITTTNVVTTPFSSSLQRPPITSSLKKVVEVSKEDETVPQDDSNPDNTSSPPLPLPPDTDSKPQEESPGPKPISDSAVEPNPVADIFTCYAENIGELTALVRDTLTAAIEEYPADWILDALSQAVKYNKRNWAYAETILRRKQTESSYANPPPSDDPVSEGKDNSFVVRNQPQVGDILAERKTALTAQASNSPPFDTPAEVDNPALQTPWDDAGQPSTIAHAWELARNQIELQLDPASFDTYLRDTHLIDFHPSDHAFVFAAPNEHIRDTCQHRLSKHIDQVLSSIYGQLVHLKFILPDSAPVGTRRCASVATQSSAVSEPAEAA